MGALRETKSATGPVLKAHDGGLEDQVEYEPSGIFKRFVAAMVDGTIVTSFNLILQAGIQKLSPVSQEQLAAGNNAAIDGVGTIFIVAALVGLIFNIGYYVYSMKKWSATPGKKLLGLKVIRIGDNKEWGFGSVFMREVIGKIISSIGMMGYIWAFFGEKKQAWHDKLVKSMVVRDQ